MCIDGLVLIVIIRVSLLCSLARGSDDTATDLRNFPTFCDGASCRTVSALLLA